LWWSAPSPWRTTNETIESRHALLLPRMRRLALALHDSIALDEGLLALADQVDADGLLELEDQARADRLEDRRGAALLAVHRIGEVAVVLGVDVRDGAAARLRGDAVLEQGLLRDEHAGRAGAADELVR